MIGFFNPGHRPFEIFPMYGTGHLILLVVLIAFIPLMVWQKDLLRRLRHNRRFMVTLSWFILIGEAQSYVVKFIYGYQPFFERLPFHLCGTMAILLPILVLTERYDIIRFFAGWSIACGLISFLNLGTTHNGPESFSFYQYLWKHYYLFLFPIFLFIAGEFEIKYREYAKSMAALVVYSGIMFLVNWAFTTNYLYIGPNNDLAVPFLPDNLLVWPMIYPSFIAVGLILFHIIYVGFGVAQLRRPRV
jgi:hypothetical integral membrane protein (TIGR02206 family)